MTIKEAQQIVAEKIMKGKTDCELISGSTREHETCYTFYYQSKSYLKSRNMSEMLVGHGPILIDKLTGDFFETGSAYSEEQYVNAFEACGDPLASPTKNIVVQGWLSGAEKVSATRFIKKVSALSLSGAKRVIDNALDDKSTTFVVASTYDISEILRELRGYGFQCKQLWEKNGKKV